MSLAREAALRAALDLATSALRVQHSSGLAALLGDAAEVIGADTASLARIDLGGHDEMAILWPPSRAASAPVTLEAYQLTARTHPARGPLLRSVRENRPWTLPIRLSEVVTDRGWHETPVCREVLESVTDQLCLPLAYTGTVLTALSLSRLGGHFSGRDSDALLLVAPHVRAAVARTRGTSTLALRLDPTVSWVPACFAAPARWPEPALGASATCTSIGDTSTRDTGARDTGARDTGARDTRGPARADDEPAVTPREREVLDLVADGLTDAAIARRLGLASATVSKHLHRLYVRHGLSNRAVATRWWLHCRGSA